MPSDVEDESDSPGPGSEDDSDGMADPSGRVTKNGKSKDNNNKATAKSNAKDPNRPKRKKARRACFACQRAHLTCGDERPCTRCIKRGLGEQCADGVRKKAKYLRDPATEAFVAPFPGQYHINGSQAMHSLPGAHQLNAQGLPAPQPGSFYPQTSTGPHFQYSPVSQSGPMAPPGSNMIGDYTAQLGIEPSTQFPPNTSQQVSPVTDMALPMTQSPGIGRVGHPSFDNSVLDFTDPSMLAFNPEDMNFSNRYAAMEYGIMGQLSSGAFGMDIDPMQTISQPLDDSPNFSSGVGFDQNFQPWQNVINPGARQGSSTYLWTLNNQNNGFDAVAIREGHLLIPYLPSTSSITGASDAKSPDLPTNYSSSTRSPDLSFNQGDQKQHQHQHHQNSSRQSLPQSKPQKHRTTPFPSDLQSGITKKARRDTSVIYSSVVAPYPYTVGFHNLTEHLNTHFHSKNVLRIAKALGAIRPSFISCNQNLNHDDLIFMEKSFQRTMYEYELFMESYGTPTVLCRRTGEVASANKEFTLLTGWRLDVLRGREPNLNVNTDGNSSGTQTGSTTKGVVTPAVPAPGGPPKPGQPKSVLLPEILDEDSTVQFYEDFAELAFGASRSSIIGSQCYLLKYKTKNDPGWESEKRDRDVNKDERASEARSDSLIKGESGVKGFGEADGKVRAVLSWTVKRDLFDIPMLIVLNFLPIIQ